MNQFHSMPSGPLGSAPLASMPPGHGGFASMPPGMAPMGSGVIPQTLAPSGMHGPPLRSAASLGPAMMAAHPGFASGHMASHGPVNIGPYGSAGPQMAMQGQYMPSVARPVMTHVANPPVVANNVQYGPSYKMQYQKRSTSDKTAVKYTGFLPLEGVYEEDTCRIG
eukprot:TRINITY_DN5591_c0_g1_i2.p1 TRINITY_DN5591_c0_g1~~TRINITY_DN5591_c0_g1_i2.p1  ORF type:complete len:166 (+),score=12.80 TRINITY_DN5591_c0_g1_i2:113-610(+)